MFRGIHSISIDSKGRIAVPKRYRETLSGTKEIEVEEHRQSIQVIVTIDTESPCLLLYPLYEWEIIETKLQNLPSFNPATRRIQRLLIGHATDLDMDGNGRLLIPPVLRDYAKLEKKVMLVGQGKKIEIWNEGSWNHLRQEWLNETTKSDQLPDDLQDLSL